MLTIATVGFSTDYVHPERQAQIDAVNAAGTTWKAKAHPRFADQAPGASKNLLGVKGNWQVDIAEAIKRGEIERYTPAANAADPPTDWDAATAFPDCAKTITDIRDQSACGCCWAFGGAEAASDRMCIATNASLQLPLSAQDVCFCSSMDGCGGGQITTPWCLTALPTHPPRGMPIHPCPCPIGTTSPPRVS